MSSNAHRKSVLAVSVALSFLFGAMLALAAYYWKIEPDPLRRGELFGGFATVYVAINLIVQVGLSLLLVLGKELSRYRVTALTCAVGLVVLDLVPVGQAIAHGVEGGWAIPWTAFLLAAHLYIVVLLPRVMK